MTVTFTNDYNYIKTELLNTLLVISKLFIRISQYLEKIK